MVTSELENTPFFAADQTVALLSIEIIQECHPDLEQARIGFLFRHDPTLAQGKLVRTQASLIPAKLRLLAGLDFIIWIAQSSWEGMHQETKEALLDHELSHCKMDDAGNTSLAAHDIEDFIDVIERRGNWTSALQQFSDVQQQIKMDLGDE